MESLADFPMVETPVDSITVEMEMAMAEFLLVDSMSVAMEMAMAEFLLVDFPADPITV